MILCVALKLDNELIFSMPRPARHHDLIHRYYAMLYTTAGVMPVAYEQGFLNDKGEFLTRGEAYEEAIRCGALQPRLSSWRLYSEDLW